MPPKGKDAALETYIEKVRIDMECQLEANKNKTCTDNLPSIKRNALWKLQQHTESDTVGSSGELLVHPVFDGLYQSVALLNKLGVHFPSFRRTGLNTWSIQSNTPRSWCCNQLWLSQETPCWWWTCKM